MSRKARQRKTPYKSENTLLRQKKFGRKELTEDEALALLDGQIDALFAGEILESVFMPEVPTLPPDLEEQTTIKERSPSDYLYPQPPNVPEPETFPLRRPGRKRKDPADLVDKRGPNRYEYHRCRYEALRDVRLRQMKEWRAKKHWDKTHPPNQTQSKSGGNHPQKEVIDIGTNRNETPTRAAS